MREWKLSDVGEEGEDGGMLEIDFEGAFGEASHSGVNELGVSVVGLDGVRVTSLFAFSVETSPIDDSVSAEGSLELKVGVFSSSRGITIGLSSDSLSGKGIAAFSVVDGTSGVGDSSYKLTGSDSTFADLQ